MTPPVITRLQSLYRHFGPALLPQLAELYNPQILFVDPLHSLQGLEALERYLAGTMEGLTSCEFYFRDTITQELPDGEGQTCQFWVMHYRHPKLAGGRALSLEGCSQLKYRDRIFYHRDYYDLGAMLYEHVPVLGGVLGYLKGRMVSA